MVKRMTAFEVIEKINKGKRSITLIGDSMIKNIQGHRMKQGMSSGDKVFVRCFAGAKTECMNDYIKPSLKYYPDVVVLHVGTNDLRGTKTPEEIGEDILTIARKIKTPNNEVIISSVIFRNEGSDVNKCLKLKCDQTSFLFCDNSNISGNCLNGGGLDLNPKGTITLAFK